MEAGLQGCNGPEAMKQPSGGGLPQGGCGAEGPNGQPGWQARSETGRPGTLTPEWRLREEQPLRASERPFGATGPIEEKQQRLWRVGQR
jgi:hypothetical protein